MLTNPLVGLATDVTRRLASRYSSPVVLYHSTFESLPAAMAIGVHNVFPDQLIEQIEWLSRSLKFLPVDEWFEEGKPAGTAVVTFDDGYRSVCENALPRLIDLNIPSTVFINGSSLRGEVFWRDKVLFLINCGLVEDFLAFDSASEAALDGIEPSEFYKASKHPSRNSRVVDLAIDRYLGDRDLERSLPRETVRTRDELVEDPLVTYGNHSYRHYIPSSLTDDEQLHELEENERVLDSLGVNRSRTYSIPFGDSVHVDETTERLVGQMGFVGVLFSSNAANFGAGSTWAGLPTGQRYMAQETMAGFRFHHARLSWLPPDAKSRAVVRAARDRLRVR